MVEKLKSKRLGSHCGYRHTVGRLLTNGSAPTKKSEEDWEKLRKAKILHCPSCAKFDSLLGGCTLHLVPSLMCPSYAYSKRKAKVRKQEETMGLAHARFDKVMRR